MILAKLLAVGFGTRPDFNVGIDGGDQSDSAGSGLGPRFLTEATDVEDIDRAPCGIGFKLVDGPGLAFRCVGRRWR